MGRIPRRAGWLPLRLARLFFYRNGLRRSSDRVESALVAGLLAALAAMAVTSVLLAGHVYHNEQATARTGLRLASAVLTPPGAVTTKGTTGWATAQATWRLSNGTERSGLLNSRLTPSLYSQPAGSSVPVWLDRSGTPEPPPRDALDFLVIAASAGLSALGGAVAVVAVGYRLCRRALDVRRLARWEAGWEVTGPRWTRQQ